MVKNACNAFFMLQRLYKMRCLAILGCFWRLWSELEGNRRIYCKIRHIERQNDFWTKNANNIFLSEIWKYWIDVHLRIVKLESGTSYQGQLPVMKKNCAGNRLNLEKSSFVLIVLKTYVFTQITECSIVTHLYYQELELK